MVGRAKAEELLKENRLLITAAIKIDADISDALDHTDMSVDDIQKFEEFQQALEHTMFETEARMETTGRKLANYNIVEIDEIDVWCLEVQKFSLTSLIKHYNKMLNEYMLTYYGVNNKTN